MTRKTTKTAIFPEPLHFFARRYVFFILTCFSILAILSGSLLGSDAPKPQHHAVIFGTVWGPDDHVLSGVEVKVRRASEKKGRWDVYSNRRGEFEVAVPAGKADYLVWAVTKHYKLPNGRHLQSSPEVTVHIDNDGRADTGLHLK